MTDITSTNRARSEKEAEAQWVLRKLIELVSTMEPGDKLPSLKDLVNQLQSDECFVLNALSRLQDKSVVVLSDSNEAIVAMPPETVIPRLSPSEINDHTIVAIANPDHSYYDHCVRLLFLNVEVEGRSSVCRFVDPSSAQNFTSLFGDVRPLGFVVLGHRLAHIAVKLRNEGYRVVLIGAPIDGVQPDVPSMFGDHETGGEMAASYLISLGHRRIAYFGEPPLQQEQRTRGHELAIARARLDSIVINWSYIKYSTIDKWKSEPSSTSHDLRKTDAPTAIITWNDHEALQLLDILNRAGVRVPEEISVIGYDNLPEGSKATPALTTIDSSVAHLIGATVELISSDRETSRDHSVMVMPSLVIRQSTSQAPQTELRRAE